jgi:hypothetical protein
MAARARRSGLAFPPWFVRGPHRKPTPSKTWIAPEVALLLIVVQSGVGEGIVPLRDPNRMARSKEIYIKEIL